MPQVIALETNKLPNNRVYIFDSRGNKCRSKSAENIFGLMLEPYDDALKIVWDMGDFLKPVFELLPDEVVKKLNNGESARFKNFKLFYGVGKGRMFGVTYKNRVPLKGNFYKEEVFEYNIYEIKIYFPNGEPPINITDVRDRGYHLVSVLKSMGITPSKLTSPAAIYEEAVLKRMPMPTIFNMPEKAIEMAEWCANYVREWRTCYKIGAWESR